jgi:hypothetical protein
MNYFISLYLRVPNQCTLISMSWQLQMYIYIYGNMLLQVSHALNTTNLTSFTVPLRELRMKCRT